MDEAAQKFSRITEWESGASFPTYPQLEQFADSFRIPIAVFFFPEPPNVPPIRETFRTLPDAEFQRIPSRVRLLLRKAKALQPNLIELTQGRNPADRLITRDIAVDPGTTVEQLTTTVREYLGVTVHQQEEWGDNEIALKEWRRALFEVGIFVFKDAFRIEEYSGVLSVRRRISNNLCEQ